MDRKWPDLPEMIASEGFQQYLANLPPEMASGIEGGFVAVYAINRYRLDEAMIYPGFEWVQVSRVRDGVEEEKDAMLHPDLVRFCKAEELTDALTAADAVQIFARLVSDPPN